MLHSAAHLYLGIGAGGALLNSHLRPQTPLTQLVNACRSDALDLNHTEDSIFTFTNGPYPVRYTLDLQAGKASLEHLTDHRSCEFPTLHAGKVGRKTKYAYCGVYDSSAPGEHKVNFAEFAFSFFCLLEQRSISISHLS